MTFGKSKVGEGVKVDVEVRVGVEVALGVRVMVGVSLAVKVDEGVKVWVDVEEELGVKVQLEVGVWVHAAAVAVCADAMIVPSCSVDESHALVRRKMINGSNQGILFMVLFHSGRMVVNYTTCYLFIQLQICEVCRFPGCIKPDRSSDTEVIRWG